MDEYRSSVRVALGRESHEYKFFRYIFKEWEQKRMATPVVATLFRLLLSDGHQELIERFNQFLPAEYKISLPLSRRPAVNIEGATSFIQKVKAALDEESYISFLHTVNIIRTPPANLLEMTRKVCEFLQDRQDLLQEFTDYLPDPLKATLRDAFNNTTTGESSQARK